MTLYVTPTAEHAKRPKPCDSVVDMESQIELFNSIVVNGYREYTPAREANSLY